MISSRNLLNLVLLVAVLALVAIMALEPGKTPEPASAKLTHLTADEINHILIQRADGTDIELEKINGVWQMIKPYALPANEFRMTSLLRLAEAESISQNDLSKLKLETFSLDKPRATIIFNKQHEIIFGGNEPLQQHRYTAINNILHLVSDTFYYPTVAKETTFIDHQLLAGQQNISKLELPGLNIEFKQAKWQVLPPQDDISADAITDLINQWRNSQALELRAIKNNNTKQSARVYFKDQDKPMTFAIQQNKDETLLIRNDIGIGYVLTNDNYAKLVSLSAAHKAEADEVTK